MGGPIKCRSSWLRNPCWAATVQARPGRSRWFGSLGWPVIWPAGGLFVCGWWCCAPILIATYCKMAPLRVARRIWLQMQSARSGSGGVTIYYHPAGAWWGAGEVRTFLCPISCHNRQAPIPSLLFA